MDFIIENNNEVTSNNVTGNEVTNNKVKDNKNIEKKDKICSFRVNDTLRKKIKIMALYEQKKMNELLTDIITAKVKEYESNNKELFDKFDF